MVNITLDFGHGGKDSGATGNGLREKDRVLAIGLKVGKELERQKLNVTYTRKGDIFIPLKRRSEISNNSKADLFVSIHLNSFSDSTAQGFEIYNSRGSTKGLILAKDIHDEIIKQGLYTKDRGVKQASFSVIGRRTKAKSVLLELGFISNKEDMQLLGNKEDEFVKAITVGILNNLGMKYKPKGFVEVPTVKPKDENHLYDWAKHWNLAKAENVTDGTRPNGVPTRAEVIEMIYRKGAK